MRSVSCLVGVLAIAACSSAHDDPAPVATATPHDAGTLALAGDAVTAIVAFDPHSGMHLDDDGPPRAGRPPGPTAVRQHPIDVTLRSSPSGALAAVDGVPIGTTPSFWAGDANGREHEFTFVLAGYAVARYRFVPITSGVIHARLDAVADDPDAGVDEVGPSWTAPSPTAVPAPAPPPPPTLVAPAPRPAVVAPPPTPDAGAPPAVDAAVAPPEMAPASASAGDAAPPSLPPSKADASLLDLAPL